ncbi:hypothetical protein JHK85_016774 [Glycine max]|nr:hypothetical protein JHK85_016774 [Glycine max]
MDQSLEQGNLLDAEGPNASSSRMVLTNYAATASDNRDYILSQDFFWSELQLDKLLNGF